MDTSNHENLKTSITEPIINKEIVGVSYEIGILNKKEKIKSAKMTFDKSQRLILLNTTEGIEIKIHFDNVLSFTKVESNNIKAIRDENKELNNSKISFNLDMRIFDLYYFPKFSYKSCRFFGVFVCKPTETVRKRVMKVFS